MDFIISSLIFCSSFYNINANFMNKIEITSGVEPKLSWQWSFQQLKRCYTMISSVLADFYDTSTAVFFPLWVVCYSKFLIKLNKTVHPLCSIVLIPVLVMTGSFLCNFKMHNSLCFSTEIMHHHSCPSGSKKTFFCNSSANLGVLPQIRSGHAVWSSGNHRS